MILRTSGIYLLLIFLISSLHSSPDSYSFPQIAGWEIQGEVLSYHSDNLWEYINGAADQFIDYDFVEVRACDLKQADILVTVEIYEMSSELCAFGIYTAERPAKSEPFNIGGEAVVLPPGQLLLFKDRYYVKIYAVEGELSLSNGPILLQSVAAALPGEGGLPVQLQSLPSQNRISGSERYIHKNYAGLGELSRSLFAEYEDVNGHRYQLFCLLPGSDKTNSDIGYKLSQAGWRSVENTDISILYREIPYVGYMGIRMDLGLILGVAYTNDLETLISALKEISR